MTAQQNQQGDAIVAACRLLFTKGQTVELRAINVPKRATVSGYFNNGAALSAAAASLSGVAESVYVTLNPVNPELQARANNRLQDYAKNTTGDKDILTRRWLPIDFDAVRPSGISSTDDEHDDAKIRAGLVAQYLTDLGWPEPIAADSGNGAHLLYRIDLPNDDASLMLVKGVLKHLADRWSDDAVKVDAVNFNAARIWKLYGTMACKGDDMADRPHRLAAVLSVPASMECVTVDQMQALVPVVITAAAPAPSWPMPSSMRSTFNLSDWIAGHGLDCKGPFDHQGGRKWILAVCPFNSAHNRGEAMLGETPSGAAYFKCQHDSCSHQDWQAFRAVYDGVRPAYSANDNRPAPAPQVKPVAAVVAAPAAAVAVDYLSPLPDCNDRMKPLATIENLAEICRRLSVTVRYNVISKEEELLIPNGSFSVDNRQNASLAWLTSWCARFKMASDKLGDYVTYLADQNQFNPVAQWITSKPWDGVSRLPQLYATITSTDEQLKEILMRRWLLSAIAAAVEPDGVSAHGVLVIQGSQYLGKTKWFKSLVPADLGVVQDGMMLRPDDRDSVKQIVSFWLVELGELDATFRKSDIAALKSFLTRKNDVLRRAYARKESTYARRTVFFGSVNPKQFLHDPSGNRRYWTIEATNIDHSHSVDMQQVWAEVHAMYQAGERHYLLPDEMDRLNGHNEDFTVSDPITERLQSRLEWDAHVSFWRWRSATDVLIEVGMDRPNQSDVTKAATIIRGLNGNQAQKSRQGRQLLVPPMLRV